MSIAATTVSGMDAYFERLVKGPPFADNDEMRYEGVRLKTYTEWPSWGAVWPTLLARAGFYYTRSADEVVCFCCSLRLKSWEAGDSPSAEHKRFFPQCRFVTGEDSGNVPLGGTAKIRESPPPPHNRQETPSPTRSIQATSNHLGSLAPTRYSGAGRGRASSCMGLSLSTEDKHDQRRPIQQLLGTSTIDGPMKGACSRQLSSGGSASATADRCLNPQQLHDMKLESRRLRSFVDWPTGSYVRPEILAKTGLYYLGVTDRVKCAFCNGVLRNWEAGDVPAVEHRKFFPNCVFLRDTRAAGNVSIQEENIDIQHASQNVVANPSPSSDKSSELGVTTERPVHQNQAVEATRLSTFRHWPRDSSQSPETLAGAGFFYTGCGDNVKCFFCDGGLRNWEMGDDPWTEHARWFPRCIYLKTVKGEDFILSTRTTYHQQGATVSTSGTTNLAARTTQPTAPGRFPVEARAVRARMDTSAVQVVLTMGYSRDLLIKVIEHRLVTVGDDFPNVQSLLEAVFAAEELYTGSSPQQPPQLPTSTATTGAATPGNVVPAAAATAATAMTTETTALENALAMGSVPKENIARTAGITAKNQRKKRKNRSGAAAASPGKAVETVAPSPVPDPPTVLTDAERLQCKICMDDEAQILFLPCGHLCCCSKCAPALRNCPICRALIRGTVRVYLP